MLVRALVVWLVLAALAIANGALRNLFLTPRLGEQAGHALSTVILCVAIFAVSWASIRWIGPRRPREALAIGVIWVLTTVSFEFLAGHYVFGHSWDRLFADYNLARGRVWMLVVLATLLAPGWAWKVRANAQSTRDMRRSS